MATKRIQFLQTMTIVIHFYRMKNCNHFLNNLQIRDTTLPTADNNKYHV